MSDLTIARSLRRAKALRGDIATLDARIKGNTHWKKGDEPDFRFAALIEDRTRAVAELTRLRAGIAHANATHTLTHREREMSLCEAVLHMAELKGLVVLYHGLDLCHGEHRERGMDWDDGVRRLTTEVTTFQAVMTEAERAAKLEELRREIDELNELLEEANHRTAVK